MKLVCEYKPSELTMREYTSQNFKNICADKGIMYQFTNLYTPEQDGVSERLNRTLIESPRYMLYHATMPLKSLGRICEYCCFST